MAKAGAAVAASARAMRKSAADAARGRPRGCVRRGAGCWALRSCSKRISVVMVVSPRGAAAGPRPAPARRRASPRWTGAHPGSSRPEAGAEWRGGRARMNVDFGRTAGEYARFRAGFPEAFFERLQERGIVVRAFRALDLGTGTGAVARALAKRGCEVTGVDRSESMLAEARRLDVEAGVSVRYIAAGAEATGLAADSFDLVTAGQCWHWFDGPRAAAE